MNEFVWPVTIGSVLFLQWLAMLVIILWLVRRNADLTNELRACELKGASRRAKKVCARVVREKAPAEIPANVDEDAVKVVQNLQGVSENVAVGAVSKAVATLRQSSRSFTTQDVVTQALKYA